MSANVGMRVAARLFLTLFCLFVAEAKQVHAEMQPRTGGPPSRAGFIAHSILCIATGLSSGTGLLLTKEVGGGWFALGGDIGSLVLVAWTAHVLFYALKEYSGN